MNADAETLSRYPIKWHERTGEYTEAMPPDTVAAIWQVEKNEDVPWAAVLVLD